VVALRKPTGQSATTVTLLIESTSVLTAANGDQLRASFIGSGLLDLTTREVTFIGVETYDGVTGRFVQATGSSNLQGDASIVTDRGFFTVNGRSRTEARPPVRVAHGCKRLQQSSRTRHVVLDP
jgi:hypothetical protein